MALNKNSPLCGGCSSYVELPPKLKRSKHILNVRNDRDNRCFLWCLVAAFYAPSSDPTSTASYPAFLMEDFNLKGITFPLALKSIKVFERNNKDISINVFGASKKGEISGPLYYSNNADSNPRHANLLLITKGHGKTQTSHYCLITDLSELCRKTFFSRVKTFICERCLNHFHAEEKFTDHKERCRNYRACKTKVPEPGSPESVVKFKNFSALLKCPYVIYIDFECLTTEVSDPDIHLATRNYQKHVPYSCGYHLVCSFNSSLSHSNMYRGKNPEIWLINQLRRESLDIKSALESNRNTNMTPLSFCQRLNHKIACECFVCGDLFTTDNYKTAHHDHLTGKYQGAACDSCNLKIKIINFVPCILHNLSRYDAHIIIQALTFDNSPIDIIPNTTENYISFIKDLGDGIKFRFIDSYRFMSCSLDQLAKNLAADKFIHVRNYFKNSEQCLLACKKGVFPYDYVNEWGRLDETRLPEKEKFYNQINARHISDADYAHAQNVWKNFEIKTLGQYSDLYLMTDVLLLADVFENFRVLCMENYGLEAACFFTAPGLSFAAALKITKIKLELLTDIDMVLFFEAGIHGGITQASLRHVRANNKFLQNFNVNEEVSYLCYVDANNLYGHASSESLPTSGFKWMEHGKEQLENLLKSCHYPDNLYGADAGESLVLEVDLEYPRHLHDKHSDLAFLPHHQKRTYTKKLMCTLEPRQKYVLHYRNLVQALSNGLILSKIYRVIRFNQSRWLREFIMFNTKLRQRAVNDFEKNFFKLINNANFGKCMENVRKYRTIKLVSSWKQAQKYIIRPEFKSSTIFNSKLVAIELWPRKVVFNKPLYVGMCILDLSKILMYNFHYQYIKSAKVSTYFNSRLCYCDTDSFIYKFTPTAEGSEITIYDIFKRDVYEHFDTSDYPENNVFGMPRVNKKILGKFTDELKGKIMSEFIALRPKMYAYKVDNQTKKRLKGVSESAVRYITFEDYLETLMEKSQMYASFNNIRSVNHTLYSTRVTKLALDSNDDKRYILADGIDTLAIGHYAINSD